MSLNEEVELLRNIPMFARIEPSKLKLLAFTSERLTFQSGQDLCVQGGDGDSAFIIIEGDADVIVDSPNGPLTVAAMGRNDVVGEIAILCDVPRTATVRATTDLTALKISKDLFFRLVTEFPQMAVEIMRVLATRLNVTTAQLLQARQQGG
ncbi:MAG: cyclic nucleotide-binding domain-containing protein [Alphaproteobacteria bacterium]|nr:cyclic nucleotide-binding domain-containing protein [Alphaproteobacteria bacterium]